MLDLQLIANLIAVTALGGAATVVALVVVKALIALAATGSSKADSVVASQKVCKYCGAVLAEDGTCKNCGAVRQP